MADWDVVSQTPAASPAPQSDVSNGIGGVGAQTTDYAKQTADINKRIDGLIKDGALPTGPDKDTYDALVRQRSSIAAKAKDLGDRTEKAGALAPDFDSAVGKATAAAPKTPDPWAVVSQEPANPAEEAPAGGPPEPKTATDIPPEQKEAGPGGTPIRFGGSTTVASTVPEGPSWEEAQKTLLDLDKQGVPKTDPRYQQALKDKALGLQRLTQGAYTSVANIGGVGARAVGEVAPALIKGGKAIVGAADDIVSKGAREAADKAAKASEGIRSEVTQTAAKTAAEKEAAAATTEQTAAQQAGAAEKKVADIASLQSDIAKRQPTVAAERAAAQAPGKVLANGKAVVENPAAVRNADITQRSVAQRQADVAARAKEEQAAGASAQQAKDLAVDHELRVEAAKKAADDVDADIASIPTMTPDAFGEKLRDAAQQLQKRLTTARNRASGYDKVLDAAGDKPTVNTEALEEYIIGARKSSMNPNVQSVLDKLQSMMAEHENKLTLRQADDLQKTIGEWVNTRAAAGTKEGVTPVNSAAVAALKPIKNDLIRAAVQAHPEYGVARQRWGELSRPLNVLARNSGLGKILDKDPVTTAFKRDLSDVVGEVIKKTNKGNKSIDALLQNSPDLKDSARLYFAREIFEGGPVTDAKIATFLKKNEGALKRFGLYDDFKSVQAAKKAAKDAVSEATGARDQSLAEAKAAAKREEATRQATEAAFARVKAQRELPERLAKERESRAPVEAKPNTIDKGTAGKPKPSLEARRTEATKTAQSTRSEGVAKATKLREAAKTYKNFADDIANPKITSTEDVPAAARKFADKLRDDGILTGKTREDYISRVNEAEKAYQSAKDKLAARKILVKRIHGLAKAALYLGGGYEAMRVSGLTGLLP